MSSSSNMWSTCPFCLQQVVTVDLERHANNHFEDHDHQEVDSSTITYGGGGTATTAAAADSNIHFLISSQVRDANFKVKQHGFMTLLYNCLECESGQSTSILSGYVDHFQSIEFEDVGWGCGWRNIQMLTSHLLVERKEAKDVLFGGVGFVPDISSLQKWLEVAWHQGFDTPGSYDFHQNIHGKRTWIGTTECAALFRSFGLRARIVDFSNLDYGSNIGKRNKSTQVIGPMDRYLNKSPQYIVAGSSNDTNTYFGIHPEKRHQLLVNWVWSYFSDNNMLTRSACNKVVITDKSPLYFQHDGHSRTIVGIQMKNLPNGVKQQNLLILDPAHKTEVLESCLSKNVGWQRFIKRGVHTLQKMEYQLCYVDPGIATGMELEKLKTLDSTRFGF
uniref:zinc finger-containing ubiquitin peptidase 1 isoform X2 n=1 Tax=Erigeron canadensis TaxID=72917 RepID=UPI001CB94CBE|nr:zinc finger-containing ubiquitin peptidase 1 isoform X2 [Erigeron canadensis]